MSSVMEELLKEQQIKQDKEHEAAMKTQQKSFAERMLKGGKLTFEEIAAYSGLSLATVKRLAKKLESSD